MAANCKICNENIDSADDFFQNNVVNHSDEPVITCTMNDCLRFYSNKKSLKNHIESHLDNKLVTISKTQNEEILSNTLPVNSTNDASNTASLSDLQIISELKVNLLKQALHLLADENIARNNSLEILRNSFQNFSMLFRKLVESGCVLNSERMCFYHLQDFFLCKRRSKVLLACSFSRHLICLVTEYR